MSTRRRALALNLILALGSLLFTAVVAEIALRVFPPPSLDKRAILSEVGRMVPPYLMLPDPEIGWVLAPNFRGEGHGPGWKVTLATNSLGLRDREYAAEDTADHVVVVGDSYTFGFGVEAEETFPKVAEEELRATPLAGMEVVNAGVSGYGPFEEAAFLRRVVPKFRPRAVVQAFFEGNDVRNAIEYPLRFKMGPEGYLHREGWDPFATPLSYLATYAAMKGRNVGEKLATRRGIELSHQAILDARRYAEQSGARYLLLLLPDVRSERAGRSWALRAYDAALGSGGDINAGMESFARDHGVDVLNLSALFDSAPDAPPLRFSWDGHFTRDGHRLAGRELARRLQSLLAASAAGAPG
ncbi:MAG: SGNH/GDSL hydrolase family protein [Acidobacteria bacterium]|nr:SGNH/GDSL hydrolase family protein [Acidobacteriota bacterium]